MGVLNIANGMGTCVDWDAFEIGWFADVKKFNNVRFAVFHFQCHFLSPINGRGLLKVKVFQQILGLTKLEAKCRLCCLTLK